MKIYANRFEFDSQIGLTRILEAERAKMEACLAK